MPPSVYSFDHVDRWILKETERERERESAGQQEKEKEREKEQEGGTSTCWSNLAAGCIASRIQWLLT